MIVYQPGHDRLGPQSAADGVAGLQQRDLHASAGQGDRGGEPVGPAAHDRGCAHETLITGNTQGKRFGSDVHVMFSGIGPSGATAARSRNHARQSAFREHTHGRVDDLEVLLEPGDRLRLGPTIIIARIRNAPVPGPRQSCSRRAGDRRRSWKPVQIYRHNLTFADSAQIDVLNEAHHRRIYAPA